MSDVDHPVKCFTIFRGYEWPFTRILDDTHNSLLMTTYHGRGKSIPQLGDTQLGLQSHHSHHSTHSPITLGMRPRTVRYSSLPSPFQKYLDDPK